ncbi:MAG: hypothetical protein JST75_09045 [Bacteroidetes bacterium]|nr:hypothetical protein [Bacteroidota bacterium]
MKSSDKRSCTDSTAAINHVKSYAGCGGWKMSNKGSAGVSQLTKATGAFTIISCGRGLIKTKNDLDEMGDESLADRFSSFCSLFAALRNFFFKWHLPMQHNMGLFLFSQCCIYAD